jgi:hypothetical protein
VGYWIAAVIILVGAVAAVVWFVSGVSNLFSAVDDYPRFSVPGQATMPLEAASYKVFAEYPGAASDVNGVFRVGDVTVTDSGNQSIPVRSSFTEETYQWNGHEGRAIAEFTAPSAGSYTVAATLPPNRSSTSVRVSVGRGLQPSAILPLFGAAGLGGLALLVGIVLIVVTAVRRGRAKRRANPVPAFAGPPPGYPVPPGAYGQWGQPPTWGAPMPPGGYGQPPYPTGPPPPGPVGQPGPVYPPYAPPPPPGSPPPIGSEPLLSPPPQAPETPPIVPPGWGTPADPPGSGSPPEPDDRRSPLLSSPTSATPPRDGEPGGRG